MQLQPGCYADSTFGHQHVRNKLASLVRQHNEQLANELLQEMLDDASDEYEALDILNSQDNAGYTWDLVDGDLMLVKYEEEQV